MEESGSTETSVFQTKYNEFVDDMLGALPEYTSQIQAAKLLDNKSRLSRFQEEVKIVNTFIGTFSLTNFKKSAYVRRFWDIIC